MKFLHAADIHLDSPLTGLSRHPDIPEDVTRHCTRRAFDNMIDLAVAEDVAFVIIAGDLYDGDWRDYSTGLFFAGAMRRLGRPCFLVRGNHDAHSVITKHLSLPDNVREFSSRRPHSLRLDDLGVVLHGQSFAARAVEHDLTPHYPPAEPDRLNIGVLHTSAEDPGPHGSYAPCRLEALAAKGYQYWALGHIHQRAELRRAPWVVFPGNLQGRHVNEPGPKGCSIVEWQEGRVVSVRHHDCDVLRWARLEVAVTGAATPADIALRVRFELDAALGQAGGRPLIARVVLSGTTPCHAGLLADPARIDAECRAAASLSGDRLFIERVRLATAPPAARLVQEDALADLERAFLGALDDPATQRRLLEEFGQLAGLLPHTNRPDAPALPRDAEALRALAGEAWAIVRGRTEGGA